MKKLEIRCRGIIIHNKQLLVVRHVGNQLRVALPGGHLEPDEDPIICIIRELHEELGVQPEIGKLLYVHTLINYENKQIVEFFYEVKNGSEYVECHTLDRTHAHELADILWVSSENASLDRNLLLPTEVMQDCIDNGFDFSAATTKYITHRL